MYYEKKEGKIETNLYIPYSDCDDDVMNIDIYKYYQLAHIMHVQNLC